MRLLVVIGVWPGPGGLSMNARLLVVGSNWGGKLHVVLFCHKYAVSSVEFERRNGKFQVRAATPQLTSRQRRTKCITL